MGELETSILSLFKDKSPQSKHLLNKLTALVPFLDPQLDAVLPDPHAQKLGFNSSCKNLL
jgi:hypothetical protein